VTDYEPVSISIAKAATVIGISRSKCYYLAGRGELAGAYRMGGRVLVHIPTLLAWMAEQGAAWEFPAGPNSFSMGPELAGPIQAGRAKASGTDQETTS
jgi:excisionase family DNA binding protein